MNPNDYCILVAEDDDAIRYVTSRALSQHGYCVIEAGDGREAMQREAEYDGTIHLLVTNVQMPGISGHELAGQLKQKRPDLKVLIVSGDDEINFPPEASSHDAALLEPVDSATILMKVAQLLHQRDIPAR
jgi:two-component system, cell cycle sensor histidine kinase and response regulator CckA